MIFDEIRAYQDEAAAGGDDPLGIAALVEDSRLNRKVYVDEDIYRLEMVRIFGGTWSYLGHTSEVPEVGDWKKTNMGPREVLLCRLDDGSLSAVLNRCTHRGTALVAETYGCDRRFKCPYHGWSFSNDGSCKGIPYREAYRPELELSSFDLGQVRLAEHRGFVFGTLNPEAPSLSDWLGPAEAYLDAHIDRHPGGEMRVLRSPVRLVFKGNWKLLWDNAADGLHATFAHRSYNRLGKAVETETILARDPKSTEMFGKDLGHGHQVVDQRPGMPNGGWATMRPMPYQEPVLESLERSLGSLDREVLDLATGSMVNLSLFPNLIFVGNQLLVVEPISVDRTRMSLYLVSVPGAPPEIDLLRQRVEEDFTNFGTPDDLEMFERVQRGLQIPEVEWVDFSRGHNADVDYVDDDGLLTGPITSEVMTRGYLRAYRRLMTTGVTLSSRLDDHTSHAQKPVNGAHEREHRPAGVAGGAG